MINLKVQVNKLQPAMISFIAGSLKKGLVLVLPTDTIYGLSALAENQQALRRIYALKKRGTPKPLIILMSDLKMIKKYAWVSPHQERQLKKIWGKKQAPTTVILKNKGKLPKKLVSPSGGLAVRLPKSIFLIKILKALARPLVSTSVNFTGERPLRSFKQIKASYQSLPLKPDLIVNIGYCRSTKPSRLIDLRDEKKFLVIRK